jgi:hypothetical protein
VFDVPTEDRLNALQALAEVAQRRLAAIWKGRCQVAEHCWDPVGHAIVTYGYLFDRLIQARQREV